MPLLGGVVTTVTIQSVIGMVLLVTSIERYYYNGVNIYRTEPVLSLPGSTSGLIVCTLLDVTKITSIIQNVHIMI